MLRPQRVSTSSGSKKSVSQKRPLSGTSELLFLVAERQPPEAGCLGGVWGGGGSPHKKKRIVPFSWRAKKRVSRRSRKGVFARTPAVRPGPGTPSRPGPSEILCDFTDLSLSAP